MSVRKIKQRTVFYEHMYGTDRKCSLQLDLGHCPQSQGHVPVLRFNRWYFRRDPKDEGRNECVMFKWQGL